MDAMSVHGNAKCQYFVQFLGNVASCSSEMGYAILADIKDNRGPSS